MRYDRLLLATLLGLFSVFVYAQIDKAPKLKVNTSFVSDLDRPWDLAFLGDGTMFFTEKCRGLSVRKPDGKTIRLFGTKGSSLEAPDLFCEGQSGAHGIAIDPEFATNRFVYVFFASNLSKPRTNRVAKLKVSDDFTSVSNRADLINNIAFKDSRNNWGGAGAHSGGRLRFGPDGFLYVTTGDNHNGPLPQSLTMLGGKVLRITTSGAPAPGNNPPAGADPRIYSLGHRNIQGITFKPGTGQPFSCEHGPGHSDEVTALVAGGNSGWDPVPAADVQCEDNYCGYISNRTDGKPTSMTDTDKFPAAMKPVSTNSGKSQGMGPCTFLSGKKWGAWDGRLVVGIMGGQRVDVLNIGPSNSLIGTEKAKLPNDRARSLVQGPDGDLYVATDSGDIWRVTPQ